MVIDLFPDRLWVGQWVTKLIQSWSSMISPRPAGDAYWRKKTWLPAWFAVAIVMIMRVQNVSLVIEARADTQKNLSNTRRWQARYFLTTSSSSTIQFGGMKIIETRHLLNMRRTTLWSRWASREVGAIQYFGDLQILRAFEGFALSPRQTFLEPSHQNRFYANRKYHVQWLNYNIRTSLKVFAWTWSIKRQHGYYEFNINRSI